MRIRTACPDDLDEMVRLCAAHAAYERAGYDPVGKVEGLRKLLFASEPALFCRIVEREEGAGLAGYTSWSLEVSTWAAARYAHMDCLYLDSDARGQGLGHALIATIAADALARGVAELQWQTPALNADAIRFYERLDATRKEKFRFCLDRNAMGRLGNAR